MTPAAKNALFTAAPEKSPKLTDRQIADLKFAAGRTLEHEGNAAAAADAYREALLKDPARADACWRLAVLCDRQGKFNESQGWYLKALAGLPGNADLFCDIGYSFYLQKRWEEADMNLRQAVALAPDHARALNNLGLVMAHAGRPEKALAAFHEAGCSEADAHSNLAYALMMEKSWPEARQHYEAALTADASSAAARKGLRELEVLVARSAPPAPAQGQAEEADAPVPDNDGPVNH
jgi:Tfp pilus assembly protein PilF